MNFIVERGVVIAVSFSDCLTLSEAEHLYMCLKAFLFPFLWTVLAEFFARFSFFFFFKPLILFVYFWLHCVFPAAHRYSLVVESRGYSRVVRGLLTSGTSLAAEHSSRRLGLPWLWLEGHRGKVHRLRCSEACGIFLGQGLNLCPLYWQADSHPLDHQGSPAHFSSVLLLLLM